MPYDIFDVIDKKYTIESMLNENDYLTKQDDINIFIESTVNSNETDDYKIAMMESTLSDIAKNAKNAIKKIIDNIINFFSEIGDNIKAFFSKKNSKTNMDDMELLEEIEKNLDKLENPNEKVTVYSTDESKKLLNDYIKEVVKLERELMEINVKYKETPQDAYQAAHEADKVYEKFNRITSKYDEEFLKNNEKTISMSKKEAIKFSKKQLENIQVDFDELEKGSKNILKEFEKDADSIYVPKHLNILQKMSNAIATRVRKHTLSNVKKKKFTIGKIVGMGIMITGAVNTARMLTTQIDDEGNTMLSKIINASKNR